MKLHSILSVGLRRCSQLLFIGVVILLGACSSAKDLQKKLSANPVGLGYEFTSTPYMGKRAATVVLRELGPGNMDHKTRVKRRNQLFVPLVLFNYRRAVFDVTLGEQSLELPYRDFFLNAIYDESDRSGCFRLEPSLPEQMNDSVYILEVYFDDITTNGQIKYQESVILWFDDNMNFGQGTLENYRYTVFDVKTHIRTHIGLYKGGRCLLRKTYDLERPYSCKMARPDLYELSYCSMQEMGNSLSFCTRELLENMVSEINLLINGQYNGQLPESPLPPASPDQSDTQGGSSR